MLEGTAGKGRLPFSFNAANGVGRLALSELEVGPVSVQRLELEVNDIGATDPGMALPAEKFQRRRRAASTAQYVRTMSAPARRIEPRVSSITRSRSTYPAAAAASIIEYSPDTW